MELKTEARIPFPPGVVFAACRDDVTELRAYLRGIRSIVVTSRVEHGQTVDLVIDWCAGGDVPGPLRALMGKGAFEWTDTSSWNAGALAVDWCTQTLALGRALSCGARDRFLADGAGGTVLEVRGALQVDGAQIPGVPKLLGAVVAPRLEAYLVARVVTSVVGMSTALATFLSQRTSNPAPAAG